MRFPGRRVTAVTLTLRPDGSFDLSQNLRRLPGRSYRRELVPTVSYARMVGELQLAYQLYRTDELVRHELLRLRPGRRRAALDQLLDAKWTDPIATCMAIYSWIGVRESMPEAEEKIHRAAMNLQRFFGELADARVVEGLVNPSVRERVFAELLDAGRVPVFAQHVHKLAAFAIERGRDEAFVAVLARRLARNQVWSLALNAEGTDPLRLEQESVLVGA
jgi:hypothetical protein